MLQRLDISKRELLGKKTMILQTDTIHNTASIIVKATMTSLRQHVLSHSGKVDKNPGQRARTLKTWCDLNKDVNRSKITSIQICAQ